jgi:energy-coupling factor transporter transmembrane protein EcfT
VIGRTSAAGKLLCALVVVSALATVPLTARGLLAGALVVIGVLTVTRPRWRVLARRLLPALLMVGALIGPLLIAGDAPRAALVFARATLTVLAALAFAETLRPEQLGAALHALRVPPALAGAVGTLLRQLETIRGEARSIGLARRLRGAHGPVLGADAVAVLLIRSHERAERAALAQRLRGFSVEVASAQARLRQRDGGALLVSVLVAAALHASARL